MHLVENQLTKIALASFWMWSQYSIFWLSHTHMTKQI
jgi:hypothetical protein